MMSGSGLETRARNFLGLQTFSDSRLQHHSRLLFRWFVGVGCDRDIDEIQTLRRPRPKSEVGEHVQPAPDEFYEGHM